MRLFHRYSTRKHSTNDQPRNELKAANGLPWTKEWPETVFSLNRSFADILTGIILFFIIGSEFFVTYKINFQKKGGERDV